MKLAAIVIVLCAMHARPAEACSKVQCPKLVPFATAAEAMTNLGANDGATLAKAAFTLVSSKDPAHLEAVGAMLLQPARIAALAKNFCVLQMARRLLEKPPAGLAIPVAEATLDYRATTWWGTCGGPPNPPLATYSPGARKELRAIAKLVSKPDKQLAAAIAKTIAELDKLP